MNTNTPQTRCNVQHEDTEDRIERLEKVAARALARLAHATFDSDDVPHSELGKLHEHAVTDFLYGLADVTDEYRRMATAD